MNLKLKPLHEQVIFITGATSGIGLTTVHRAVEQGAKVFMVARNEDELQLIQNDMRRKGFDTAYSIADVAEIDQLQFSVDQCLKAFGRIDTFINNAGTTIHAKVMETTIDEAKRLFDTNFWGLVNGCKVAVPILRETGGAIINIGSSLSQLSFPLQGFYLASKHAVKAYTDALRRELMSENSSIQITLILPASIDTPYIEHARSHIGVPVLKAPVYAPDVVAKTILKCACNPVREIDIGATAFFSSFFARFFPRLQDKIFSSSFSIEKKHSSRQLLFPGEYERAGNLELVPLNEGEEHGHYPGHVLKSSIMTEIAGKKDFLKNITIAAGLGFYLMKRLRQSSF